MRIAAVQGWDGATYGDQSSEKIPSVTVSEIDEMNNFDVRGTRG